MPPVSVTSHAVCVVVAEHAGDDRGWGLEHELAEGGGAAGLDGDVGESVLESGANRGCDVRSHVMSDDVEGVG